MKMAFLRKMLTGLLLLITHSAVAQFPGCPDINAGADQVLPCSTPCTNLTATPFHTGAPTTYAVSSIPHAPPVAYNAAGGTAVSVNTDDVWSPIVNLPFNFCFYGVNYTTVNIGSNGAIQFGPAAGGGFHPWSFSASCPSAALSPAGDVFGVYHDTDPAYGGTIKWYLLGTAPCRIFVVSYNNLPHFSSACNTNKFTTSMIVLYETTNVIDVYVQQKQTCTTWNSGNAVIGIQRPDGAVGVAAPGRNTGPWTVNTPEAWRFTPNGTPNYTVAWFNGATQIGTGNTINVCPGGTTTYTAQVTYTMCNGTTVVDNDQVTVSFTTLSAPTVTPVNETCANLNNGSVTINNPVGAGPYTVNINGPTSGSVVEPNTAAGVANFTNLPDGNYTYTVTGANGCTYNGNFTIGAGPVCCSVTASSTNLLCNGTNNGTATANPVGNAPFSYTWTGGQTSQTATNLSPGSYTVTLTDNIGCTATANVTITAPPVLSGTAAPTNATCNGVCNGSITVTPSGGVSPYQYSLNGGAYQASPTFTGLCAGAYNITIRDANNCTVVVNSTITQPTALALSVSSTTPATCGLNNGAVTVSGSGGTPAYQYNIGGPNQASPTFTGLAPGSYTVTMTDANGCTRTVPVTIVATNVPTVSILNQQNVSCFGGGNGSLLIGATGVAPIQYSLNGGAYQASNSFGSLAAGNYTVTVRDANNCTATINVTITSPPQLTFTRTAIPVTCNGLCDGQVQITPSGGTAPYQFSGNNGATFSAANPVTGLCAGIVNIVVQDANGCLANSSVTITQPAVLSATFAGVNPICNGSCDGSVTITPSGGTAGYQYSANGGALQAGNTITGLCGGANTILVQDANGCQFTGNQALVDPPAYGIDPVTLVESNCGFNNGSITIAANGLNGPFQYSMEGGPFQASGTFPNLFGGGYSFEAIDQLGCTAQVFLGINDVEMDGVVILQTDPLCFGGNDGYMEVTNVSGAAPITFELDNSGVTQTSGIFPNVPEGSHIVTIYDGGNCVFTLPFIASQPDQITFSTTIVDVLCSGGSTGQITFTGMAGGTGALQYSIDNGGTYSASTNFTGLAAGTYNLAVRDANNCVVYGTATINQAPPLAFTSSVFDLTCNGNNSGFIQLAATGGSGSGYQFSIDNGATISPVDNFAGLAAGTYQVVIQDNALCQVTGTVTVAEPPMLTATYATTPTLCNASCDGEIAVTANGGTAPYFYSSDNGSSFSVSSTLTNLCAGTYQVIVKDDNDCLIAATQTITEPAAITLNVVLTSSTCALPNGELLLNAGGGMGGFNYSIDGGATNVATNNFTGLMAGTYDVVVTDANNCTVTSQEVLLNEASPIITGTYITDVNCNAACDGTIDVTAIGGTGALGYDIGGASQASPLITGICAGNYTVTVTDQNGCTDTETFTITEPAPLALTATLTNLLCYQDNSGEIAFNASGGTPAYFYSTDNGATFSNQSTSQFMAAGTYDLVVKDQNDCTVPLQVIITEPAELVVQNQVSNDAICHGSCDGDATVTAAGGTGGYSYTWANGVAGTNTATGLCAGSYDVTIEDANGCQTNATFLINEPAMLTIVSYSTTDVLCNSACDGTITINAPLATEFSVDGGVTFQVSNTFTGLCVGVYDIVVRNAAGCTQTASTEIFEPAPLYLNAIPEDGITICYDGYGTLSGDAVGGVGPYYYVWNTGDTTQFLNVNLTLPATFTLTVYDQNGCVSNTESADVLIRPPFVASVTTPITICPGQLATATGSGVDGLPNYNYQWLSTSLDTLGSGPTYSYTPTASETILLVANDACARYDTLQVDIQLFNIPAPDFTVNPAIGCSPLNATFTNQMDPAVVASATWTFGDGSTGNGNTTVAHQYVNVGCYDVTLQVTTVDGCSADTTLQNVVCVAPDPIADFTFSPNTPTTVNSTITFFDQSINAVSYNWDFGGLGGSTLQNPVFSFGELDPGEQIVCLEVTSQEGCVNEICKPIPFIEEFLVYVPNSFTPDDDEFNQTFRPVFPDGLIIDDYSFMIWDRWGEIIFESKDYSIGWDGTYHGYVAKEGVYTWTIRLIGGPDQKRFEYEGHVNLLK